MILRASSRFSPGRFQLLASNRTTNSLEALKAELPDLHTGPSRDIAATADIVIVCVQPKNYLAVVDEIASVLRPGAILVSITNGVTLEAIAEKISAAIVKVIPSITSTVGRGTALVTPGSRSSQEDVEAVTDFFRPFSRPIGIPREDNRIATNLASCGPALLASFCGALAQANVDRARRIGAAELRRILRESFLATAALVEAGTDLEDIIRYAATAGGSTQAALDVLNAQLPDILKQAVDATFAVHSE